MTKKALLLLFFFQMCTLVSFSTPTCCITQDKVRDILLRGELNENQIPRSLIIPIKATLLPNLTLELQFYCSIEYITISILREGEVVEQRTLSVVSSEVENFDLSCFGSGGYSIRMSTPQETLIYGEFSY